MVLFIAGLITGCGNNQDGANDNTASDNDTVQNENQEDDTAQNQETDEQESKYPFPEDAEPVGDATVTLSTAAGSSEGGNIPVLFVQENTIMDQIGMDLANFQGDKQTFIYVEKKFVEAMQVGMLTQTNLDVEGDLLKPGIYTVTAVQFENDDPNDGKVVNYTEGKFEVKEGA